MLKNVRLLEIGFILLIILYNLPFHNLNFNVVQAEDSGFTVKDGYGNTFWNLTLFQGGGETNKIWFQSYGNYSGYISLTLSENRYFSARYEWNPVHLLPNEENVSAVTIESSSTTPLGKYNLTLVCSDGTLTVNFPIYVNVIKNPYTTTPPPTVTKTIIVTQTTVSPITLTTTSYITSTEVKIVNVTIPYIINQTKTETRTLTNTVTETKTETRTETLTAKETYITTSVETKEVGFSGPEMLPITVSGTVLSAACLLIVLSYIKFRRHT
jgi:hypothetical protein